MSDDAAASRDAAPVSRPAAAGDGATPPGAAPVIASPAEWVDAYAAAWRAGDPAAAGDLFAPDAAYTFDPFGPGLRGREQIVAHWSQAIGAQSELELEIEPPLADGDRAATAWRARFARDGERVDLAAALLLRFGADGRCTELREFWLQAQHPEPQT